MDRIKKLCSYLDRCSVFADVGCDHGYCTLYMLKNGLCDRAVISDISAKCLQKAESLLSDYIENGVCRSVCCNGLPSEEADEVLIAGMGGQEIIDIMNWAPIPEKFVLQPMKNAPQLRIFLMSRAVQIIEDCVFESGGKFYRVIKGSWGGIPSCDYTQLELEFGKSREKADLDYLVCELEKKKSYLSACTDFEARKKIEENIKRIERVLSGEK